MTDERLVQACIDAVNELAQIRAEVTRLADRVVSIERMWRVCPPGGGPPMTQYNPAVEAEKRKYRAHFEAERAAAEE